MNQMWKKFFSLGYRRNETPSPATHNPTHRDKTTQSSQALYISACGQTDLGLVRKNNEDSFLIVDLTAAGERTSSSALNFPAGERGGLLMVADGMGGAEAGEIASRMAVESVCRYLQSEPYDSRQTFIASLKNSIERANLDIRQESERNEQRKGMGTTLTAGGLFGGELFFAQVGDSRGYLIRNSVIVQITQDQSLVAHLVASGVLTPEKAKVDRRRNVILQALGTQKQVEIALSVVELKRGDWAVLCSDGLSGTVEPQEIAEMLHEGTAIEEACRRLIDLANQRGGEDNITAIIAKFDGEKLPLPAANEVPTYTNLKRKILSS
jgi:PPM family protein phosphatase